MKFTLIVCTYMRPAPLLQLLQSVRAQSLYPDEILIVDGSKNHDTRKMLQENLFSNLHYFLVDDKDRGLTKQRNFGITKVNNTTDVVCFLDDDTVLTANYFHEIMKTYALYPKALGVGGYIVNESKIYLCRAKLHAQSKRILLRWLENKRRYPFYIAKIIKIR
ncbi:glycosyltransferase family 2 protein [Flavobacterium psychrophilum]|uniref:glycosyltransferase family 2 protein n=1 Tax=Flavobacterium psychrophilum TaxID=96345 RepID=UPI003526C006